MKKISFVVAVVVGLLSGPAISSAFTGVYYAQGTECVNGGTTGTIKYWTDGFVGNTSTSNTLTASCPVARPANSSGSADVAFLDVEISDHSTDQVFQCRAQACNRNYTSCITTSLVGNGAASVEGVSNLNLTGSGWSVSSRELVSIYCTIPDLDDIESKVINYGVLFN